MDTNRTDPGVVVQDRNRFPVDTADRPGNHWITPVPLGNHRDRHAWGEILGITRVHGFDRRGLRRAGSLECFTWVHIRRVAMSDQLHAPFPDLERRELGEKPRALLPAAAYELDQVVPERIGKSGLFAEHERPARREPLVHPAELDP